MEKLTYKQAYDKIIEAYFKDEIKPLNPKFCFCGTLCENTQDWYTPFAEHHAASHGYSGIELFEMEKALLENLVRDTEDELFNGMAAALEVLKQIHKERGENVEDFQFTKRQLA